LPGDGLRPAGPRWYAAPAPGSDRWGDGAGKKYDNPEQAAHEAAMALVYRNVGTLAAALGLVGMVLDDPLIPDLTTPDDRPSSLGPAAAAGQLGTLPAVVCDA